MSQFFQLLIYGLQLGTIYALVALGYTMVYGIVDLINFAHGDFLMLGAYTAFFAALFAGENFVVCLIMAMLVAGVIGVITDRIAYKPMRNQPKLSALITALGVSTFIQNLCRALPFIGPIPKAFPTLLQSKSIKIFGVTFTTTQILLIVLAILLMLGLNFIVNKTKVGRGMRAVSLDRDAAALMGININMVISSTFFIGAALAGAGGVFYGIMYPTLEVSIGSFLGNKAFIAAVVGGIGSIKGAMFGGIIMGIAEIFATNLNADVGFGVAYAILIVILLVKPAGLFGKLTTEKV
ncbi:branched-chain amino acid ABC transporter permease [Lacrimispora sp. NSJ-141]|uniref:Branched-chain amino acid ABC transporter permease n=1 Tax=Lientehia hominis TaxID=2897778 RepID=A0AAP2RIA8_9FIRM|nr:branched-chain amino acid ABC transporter permease [Lientehia hominis]MCD2491853.1 branched-chain amino acid ABC transporter permease [Lientehia hominis]